MHANDMYHIANLYNLNVSFFSCHFIVYFRMVNGLLKTAQGVPPGVSSTLQPPQDASMKLEAMKCLVAILKCMGNWMNKQLRIPDVQSSKKLDVADNGSDTGSPPYLNGNVDEPIEGSDTQSEASGEVSDVSTLEQRRAYKLELQVRFKLIFFYLWSTVLL